MQSFAFHVSSETCADFSRPNKWCLSCWGTTSWLGCSWFMGRWFSVLKAAAAAVPTSKKMKFLMENVAITKKESHKNKEQTDSRKRNKPPGKWKDILASIDQQVTRASRPNCNYFLLWLEARQQKSSPVVHTVCKTAALITIPAGRAGVRELCIYVFSLRIYSMIEASERQKDYINYVNQSFDALLSRQQEQPSVSQPSVTPSNAGSFWLYSNTKTSKHGFASRIEISS